MPKRPHIIAAGLLCGLLLVGGDILVAYTDGVTEAFDPGGEEFGEDRLRQAVAAAADRPAAELAEAVVESVRGFCRDAPQYDDITLVVAKVLQQSRRFIRSPPGARPGPPPPSRR